MKFLGWFRKSKSEKIPGRTSGKWVQPTGEFKLAPADEWGYTSEDILHLNGVWWNNAPIPPRKHKCFVQTKSNFDWDTVYRCACGAISRDGEYWMERNTRTPKD